MTLPEFVSEQALGKSRWGHVDEQSDVRRDGAIWGCMAADLEGPEWIPRGRGQASSRNTGGNEVHATGRPHPKGHPSTAHGTCHSAANPPEPEHLPVSTALQGQLASARMSQDLQ